MKKLMPLLLALALFCSLAVPAASAADIASVTLTKKFAQYDAGNLGEEAYWSNPVVTDVDGDGKLEIVSNAYTLVILDAATGAVKARSQKGPSPVFCSPIVKDLDGDGKKEIAIGYGNGAVNVFDARCAVKASWAVPGGRQIRSMAADDVDGDGKQEIVVGLGAENTSFYVYSWNGALKSGWPQMQWQNANNLDASYCFGIWADGIATGDLDGDGVADIIAPTDNFFINAFKGNGSPVLAGSTFKSEFPDGFNFGGRVPWCAIGMYEDYSEELARKNGGFGWALQYESMAEKGRKGTYGASMGFSTARFADVDGNGVSEVVVTGMMMDRTTEFNNPGNINCYSVKDVKYMTVYILNRDHTRFNNGTYNWESIPTNLTNPQLGAPLNQNAQDLSANVKSVPLVADINGDGVNEILFNSFDGKVHCYSLKDSSKELAGWPYTLPGTTGGVYEMAAEPVAADLNGDGKKEVVFASWTTNAQNSERTGTPGSLYVLDGSGKLLARQQLPQSAGFDNCSYAAPAVADIDGDGLMEIVVNTRRYGLCAYDVAVTEVPKPVLPTVFTDVPAGQYYVDPVKWAVEQKITSGTSATTFSPDATCTQAQILTFLWRAAKQPASSAELPFSLPANLSYAEGALRWAAEKGMIGGDFDPNASCNRAYAVLYIWQAFGRPAPAGASPFTDVPAHWSSAPAAAWAAEKGITAGTTATTFNPGGICNRGQIVTFLYRAYGK